MVVNSLPKILVIDDEPSMRSFLVQALDPVSTKLAEAGDASQAIEQIEREEFDIIVSDLYMPGISGLELLAKAKQSQWDLRFIIITGRPDVPEVVRALQLQAADFLLKPFDIKTLTDSVQRNFHQLIRQREGHAYRSSLEMSIQRRTQDLENVLSHVESNYRTTLEAMVAALDAREHETYAHSFRVRAYTIHLARLVGYPPALIPQLENAALLHDIGKIAVSDLILLKPGKLTPEEWVEMKKHSIVGEQILKRISFLQPAAPIIRHHHERIDGTGYPDGLRSEQIPLGARIFAFADTLDAMTSDRFYRKALGFDAVPDEIRRCSNTQFDPRIAEVFRQIPLTTWLELRRQVEQEHPPEAPAR